MKHKVYQVLYKLYKLIEKFEILSNSLTTDYIILVANQYAGLVNILTFHDISYDIAGVQIKQR